MHRKSLATRRPDRMTERYTRSTLLSNAAGRAESEPAFNGYIVQIKSTHWKIGLRAY
jgi:hypothetical protein